MLRINEPLEGRALDVEEVRLISDLRIMHARVEDLLHVVARLKQRYTETDIRKYADREALDSDIKQVDDIYLWFVALKEHLR